MPETGSAAARRAALLLALCPAACGAAPGGPALVFEPSDYLDLGSIDPGVRDVSIGVRNASGRPLTVTSVSSSCGCAGIVFDARTPLAPGERRDCLVKAKVEPGKEKIVAVTVALAGTDPAVAQIVYTGSRDGFTHDRVVDAGRVPVSRGTPFEITAHLDARFLAGTPGEGGVPRTAWTLLEGTAASVDETTVERVAGEVVLHGRGSVRPASAGRAQALLSCVIEDTFTFQCHVRWDAVRVYDVDREIVVLARDGGSYAGTVDVRRPAAAVRAACDDASVEVSCEDLGSSTRVHVRAPAAWARERGVGRLLISGGDAHGSPPESVRLAASLEEGQ